MGEVKSRLVHGLLAVRLEKTAHGKKMGNVVEVGSGEREEFGAYYYSQDEQRSMVFLTDELGEIRNWYQYDAFGQEVDYQEEVKNRIWYTGQQYDKETGQYYLRARYYNSNHNTPLDYFHSRHTGSTHPLYTHLPE